MSGLAREFPNGIVGSDPKLRKPLDYRIGPMLPKFPESYARGSLIVLKCLAQHDLFRIGEFSLSIQTGLVSEFKHSGRKFDLQSRINNGQFPMLIESVHIVDDEKRMIRSVGPSHVRLHVQNQTQNCSVRDSLYFSCVSLTFLMVPGLDIENGKLNPVWISGSRCSVGEMPHDVIQARTKMVESFTGKDSEPQWDRLVPVVRERFLPSLSIWLGDNWILATLDKKLELGLQIDDVLIGPL